MRSKSIDVRQSGDGGSRTPKTSGTAGKGTAFTSAASESMYYIMIEDG